MKALAPNVIISICLKYDLSNFASLSPAWDDQVPGTQLRHLLRGREAEAGPRDSQPQPGVWLLSLQQDPA